LIRWNLMYRDIHLFSQELIRPTYLCWDIPFISQKLIILNEIII